MARLNRNLAARLQIEEHRAAAAAYRLAADQIRHRRHFTQGVAAAGRAAATQQQHFAAAVAAAYYRQGEPR